MIVLKRLALLLSFYTLFDTVLLIHSQEVVDVVTFILFDNGSSQGGVEMELERDNFPSISDDNKEENGLIFAMKMSNVIPVSKFGQQPGTVVATQAFREDGEKIIEFDQLRPFASSGVFTPRRVYLVADGLQFVWPFIELGYNHTVSTNVMPPVPGIDLPIILQSLSDSPRVFKVYNLFTGEESQALIDNALNLTGDQALKRSTVRNKLNEKGVEDHGRTSENAWDRISPAARTIISRSFNITGIVEDAGLIDGLQIVRYFPGQGYNTHPDYLQTQAGDDFNFLPFSGGSNRFATVFLYLNEVEEGGCTVFPNARRISSGQPLQEPPEYALDMFPPQTWERRLTRECYSRLTVPPQRGTAALFYSVTPDGRLDTNSKHGACPVIKGIKWGANIWIWNKLRYGQIQQGGDSRTLRIVNALKETLYITWEGQPQKELAPGNSTRVGTYEFHRFAAALGSFDNKQKLSEYTVQSFPQDEQVWTIAPKRNYYNSGQMISDGRKRILIINNYHPDTLYLTWDGLPGAEIGPGLSMKVTTHAFHQFQALLDSYASERILSEYVVSSQSDHQVWNINAQHKVTTFQDHEL